MLAQGQCDATGIEMREFTVTLGLLEQSYDLVQFLQFGFW
jgi:hypothetical protein